MEMIMVYLDNAIIFYNIILFTLLFSIIIIFKILSNIYWFNKTLRDNDLLELLWTIIPVIFILLGIYQSVSMLFNVEVVRVNSKVIMKILAFQWYWVYNLIESRMIRSSDLIIGMPKLMVTEQPIFVPINKGITFIISANDVMHSWSLPSLGIKVDAIPGRLTEIYMESLNSGFFTGFCFELCGIGHSFMPINIIIYNYIINMIL